jgi:predicted ATP-dependent endonuclease of OLD family
MPQVEKETASEVYLQKAVLEGYRTIKKLEVEFLPGLNVIIGKNGTGKTNLMEYLYRALNLGGKQYFVNADLILLKATPSNEQPLHIHLESQHETMLSTNARNKSVAYSSAVRMIIGKRGYDDTKSKIYPEYFLRDNAFLYNGIFIKHGIPNDFLFFNKPFNYSTNSEDESMAISKVFSIEVPSFLRRILFRFVTMPEEGEGQESSLKSYIKNIFTILEKLREPLRTFSGIEDIRLSKNYNIYFDATSSSYIINNLLVEFNFNKQWLPFNSLSDGTKRIFYIISEVLAEEGLYFFLQSIVPAPSSNKIILLEEPELGLHPHQLEQLMKFLREQAKHKQIIISTHSPIVLDSVDPYELDRVQIAELTPEGTQLRRLTPEQQKKAQIFADKTGLLSDYWRFSDLEA